MQCCQMQPWCVLGGGGTDSDSERSSVEREERKETIYSRVHRKPTPHKKKHRPRHADQLVPQLPSASEQQQLIQLDHLGRGTFIDVLGQDRSKDCLGRDRRERFFHIFQGVVDSFLSRLPPSSLSLRCCLCFPDVSISIESFLSRES